MPFSLALLSAPRRRLHPLLAGGGSARGVVSRVALIDLPMSALVAFAPAVAALILVYRESGTDGAERLLKRAFDYRRITNPLWYLPMIFLMPLFLGDRVMG